MEGAAELEEDRHAGGRIPRFNAEGAHLTVDGVRPWRREKIVAPRNAFVDVGVNRFAAAVEDMEEKRYLQPFAVIRRVCSEVNPATFADFRESGVENLQKLVEQLQLPDFPTHPCGGFVGRHPGLPKGVLKGRCPNMVEELAVARVKCLEVAHGQIL